MTTYFVMPDDIAEKYGFKYGSDSNSGLSFDSAFKTLSHALCVAVENKEKIFVVCDK